MIKQTNFGIELSWNYRPSDEVIELFDHQENWNQTLITRINEASALIKRSMPLQNVDFIMGPMFIRANNNVFNIIKDFEYFTQEGYGGYIGHVYNKRYIVMLDESITDDEMTISLNEELSPDDYYAVVKVLNI